MKQLWQNPTFRRRQSEAASARLKVLWTKPAFVDKQLRAAVRNWSDPAYRQRQGRLIAAGRRPVPLAGQPAGPTCPAANDGLPCGRRGPHAYHVAVVGSLKDATLALVGWE